MPILKLENFNKLLIIYRLVLPQDRLSILAPQRSRLPNILYLFIIDQLKKMRIAHLTLLHGYNYGGLLQAYATQKILKFHGHQVITLDYHPAKRMILLRKLTLNIAALHKPIGNWLDQRQFSGVAQFNHFREQNFEFSPPCYNQEQLTKICQDMEIDAVVVGSDQVWSASWLKPPYFLDFDLEPNCKRISLAACCGHFNTEPSYLDYCAKTLSKFDAISVRNEFTAELVKKTTRRTPKIICDPTIATDIPTESVEKIADAYILVYVINRPQSLPLTQQMIENIKEATQLPVYSITPAELKGVETLLVEQAITDITPFQWHYLMSRASYVITDSFHGTIFCLKNHRQFMIPKNRLKTSIRLQTLLNHLGLESRIVEQINDISELNNLPQPDWLIIDEQIKQMAENYHKFVISQLG